MQRSTTSGRQPFAGILRLFRRQLIEYYRNFAAQGKGNVFHAFGQVIRVRRCKRKAILDALPLRPSRVLCLREGAL